VGARWDRFLIFCCLLLRCRWIRPVPSFFKASYFSTNDKTRSSAKTKIFKYYILKLSSYMTMMVTNSPNWYWKLLSVRETQSWLLFIFFNSVMWRFAGHKKSLVIFFIRDLEKLKFKTPLNRFLLKFYATGTCKVTT
jgi:hypothetical protein